MNKYLILIVFLISCKQNHPFDPESMYWTKGQGVQYWCCNESTCFPGASGEPTYFRRGSTYYTIIDQKEWEKLPSNERDILGMECHDQMGYGIKAWMHLEIFGENNVYDWEVTRHPINMQRWAWAVSKVDAIREEKEFFAFSNKGDCLQYLHDINTDPKLVKYYKENYRNISQCTEINVHGEIREILPE